MNPLRLEQMTVFDIGPCEMIDLAEAFDIPFVSVFLTEGLPGGRPVTNADMPDLRKRLKNAAVAVDTAEVFVLQPDISSLEPEIARAAELGARSIVAIHVFPGPENQAADQLAALAELAASYNLRVSFEPIAMGVTRTPSEGLRMLKRSGARNAGLTLDLLHLARTGTPMDIIAQIDPGLISSAQICDGPASIDPAFAIEEAGYERAVPGSGAFPVIDFLRALPPSVVLGMEVPMKKLRESGMNARERTRLVVEATRRLQQQAAVERSETR